MTPLTEAEATHVGHAFDAHARFIETVARRHSRAPQDVPDIVQSVGIQMCRKLRDFRGDASITTWLYRVTVNAAIDNWRGERRHDRVREELTRLRPGESWRSTAGARPDEGGRVDREARRTHGLRCGPSAPAVQEDLLLQAERAEALRAAVGRLRPNHAVLMREELDDPDVLLGSKQKSSKHRARQRLRDVLTTDPRFT